VGWKVLALIHNKRTIRKYEEILGINVREEFDEEGPFADKSIALNVVKKLGTFWKAVNGIEKDSELREKRRELAL
jgi:predicted transcriptional regulator